MQPKICNGLQDMEFSVFGPQLTLALPSANGNSEPIKSIVAQQSKINQGDRLANYVTSIAISRFVK